MPLYTIYKFDFSVCIVDVVVIYNIQYTMLSFNDECKITKSCLGLGKEHYCEVKLSSNKAVVIGIG